MAVLLKHVVIPQKILLREARLAALQGAGGLADVEVGGVAAQLRALQGGRGRGAREGEEETEEVAAWRAVGVEVVIGERRRRSRRDNGGV